MKPSFRL